MEEIEITATLQLKIDHLDDRIKKFELMLDEQMSELGAGKIVRTIRKALKANPNSVIMVNCEVLHRLVFYKFIEKDVVKGLNYFDKKTIVASVYMPNDSLILVPADLQVNAHISFDSCK